MPVNTILMLADQMHASKTAVSVSASATQAGYHVDNVRDTSWAGAWKPTDGTADEYIQIDGGSAGWLGTTLNDEITVAIAYDGRGAHQTLIKVTNDAADSPVGTFLQIKATFATVNTVGPTVDYVTLSLASGGKRYYRIAMFNSDRGGGTICPKIYAVAMFRPGDVHNLEAEYPNEAIGAGGWSSISKVSEVLTAGGIPFSNKRGSTDQALDLTFLPASSSWWTTLRDQFYALNVNGRAFWLQHTGLRNDVKADFQMVMVDGPRYASQRQIPNQFNTSIPLRTVPF